MVSQPETGSDSPIGSDRDRGRDNYCFARITVKRSKKSKKKMPNFNQSKKKGRS